MTNWVRVCRNGEIEIEDLIRFDHNNKTYVVYFSPDQDYYCTDGLCTHEEVHLEDGLVMHGEIECPMHQGIFDIKTGKAVSEPACVDLKTYETKVENKKIYIKL